MHTQEYKNMMSERKKQWWIRARKNPKKLKETLKKIGTASKKNTLLKLRGEKHPNWKGGKFTSKRDGYVLVMAPKNHPYAKKGGGKSKTLYILEHRLVMEKILGRHLLPEEEVHHINATKNDNRPENLMLVSHMAHFQKHGCPQCGFNLFTK